MSAFLDNHSLLVLQPTPFCNLDCDYCYLPDRKARRRMELPTLQAVLDVLGASGVVRTSVTIVWHAGEPLVVPPQYYRDAFDTVAGAWGTEHEISHAFQTNGTLLSEEWCDLIAEHQVRVGVSVDGPADLHDAHRRTRAGKGTHRRTMEGIRQLQRRNIPFQTIMVVTATALERADDVFAFFTDTGITRVGLNVDEIESERRVSSLAGDDDVERFRRFMQRLFDLNEASGRPLWIREFERARTLVSSADAASAPNDQVVPWAITCVDTEGNISTFSPELLGARAPEFDDFVFGNLVTEGMPGANRTSLLGRVSIEIARGVERCRNTCEYFGVCGGGAPANKFFEHGTFDAAETLYCRCVVQTPIDVVLASVERELDLSRFGAAAD